MAPPFEATRAKDKEEPSKERLTTSASGSSVTLDSVAKMEIAADGRLRMVGSTGETSLITTQEAATQLVRMREEKKRMEAEMSKMEDLVKEKKKMEAEMEEMKMRMDAEKKGAGSEEMTIAKRGENFGVEEGAQIANEAETGDDKASGKKQKEGSGSKNQKRAEKIPPSPTSSTLTLR